MTRIHVRIASVLIAAGVAAATPSVAHAAPQAPATKPSTYKLLATPSAAAVHYWKSMYIKGQKQKKGNWCGPAAAVTALTNWTGVKVNGSTQAYLANKMGTNKIGFTSPIAMARELTSYINKQTHRTGTKYKAYRNIKNQNLWNGVRGAYYYSTGPIVLTVFAKKSWYPKAGKNVAHYVVIYGFDDTPNYTQSTYLIWDPAYGKRTLKATSWQKVAYYGQLVVSGKNTPF